MLKGCQKKIIHIKNTNSPYFEEAYFILKEGCDELTFDNDMLREAVRIAKGTGVSVSKRASKKRRHLLSALIVSAAALALTGIILACIAFMR